MDYSPSAPNVWSEHFGHLRKILGRTGPFSPSEFQPGPEVCYLPLSLHYAHDDDDILLEYA